MIQPRASLHTPPAPAASSRHRPADRASRFGAALSDGAHQAGGEPGAVDRDPRGDPGDLSAVAPDPALPRPTPREGARYARAHLLQVRGREPGGQPQAYNDRRPGVLQQEGEGGG